MFQTVRFIQMMSLTFGLFTQVSGSGPLGPLVSRSSLKLDHVGSKTRLLGHQATQVSDLGPLWPSCLMNTFVFCCFFFLFHSEWGSASNSFAHAPAVL